MLEHSVVRPCPVGTEHSAPQTSSPSPSQVSAQVGNTDFLEPRVL